MTFMRNYQPDLCPRALSLFEAPLNIYLISPQSWDALKVSKHHYAHELAALGHNVFFIEPPGSSSTTTITATEVPGVCRVSYMTWFPYILKFRARSIFDLAMRHQAKILLRTIGKPPDIIWDFDNAYQFADLRSFKAKYAIFHLVDQPMKGRKGMKGADLALTTGQHYLDAMAIDTERARMIPHGLGTVHATHARMLIAQVNDSPLRRANQRPRAAFVGNLERREFDADTVLAQARTNPDVDIELIGPYNAARAVDTNDVIGRLAQMDNVTMTGRLEAKDILARSQDIDIWLISYDRGKSPDGSVNPHKILEYFATGRAVLSSRLDTHADMADLVYMPPNSDNTALPKMLGILAKRLERINAPSLQRRRADYALQFSYAANLGLINSLMAENPR